MKIKNCFNALLLLAHSYLVRSTEVQFRLIAVNGTPSVIVNGQEVNLELHEYPVYKGTVDIPLPAEYHYAITYADGSKDEEQFNRSYEEKKDSNKQKTLNEFFNRQVTVVDHPTLPRAYNAFEKSNLSNLYDDTHVATIIINANAEQLNGLYQNPESSAKISPVEVIYASPYSVRSFNNATLGISGQSTVGASKLSYRISNLKNDDNKELFKRTAIKLRAEHMDPSFMRDKIYGDILNSLGVPNTQNKFARVFINGEAVGLFDVSDDIDNKRYLRETLNNGNKYDVENVIFKADYYGEEFLWGNLDYYGEDPNGYNYRIYYYKGGEESDNPELNAQIEANMKKEHLIPFIKEVVNYPTTKQLSMDIEMFIKFMAMEFAGGAIDNFWLKPGNYYIYKDITQGQWYFLDSDFHFSLGTNQPAIDLLDKNIDNFVEAHQVMNLTRPMIDNIFGYQPNKDYLINTLKRLLETSFNINAVFKRIDSLAYLIDEDVQWDFSIPRVSQKLGSQDFKYTYEDFNYHVTATEESQITDPLKNILPLKYWILQRGHIIASQLQIPYPENVDDSLGYVETPKQANSESGVLPIYSVKNSIFSCLAILFITTFILF